MEDKGLLNNKKNYAEHSLTMSFLYARTKRNCSVVSVHKINDRNLLAGHTITTGRNACLQYFYSMCIL